MVVIIQRGDSTKNVESVLHPSSWPLKSKDDDEDYVYLYTSGKEYDIFEQRLMNAGAKSTDDRDDRGWSIADYLQGEDEAGVPV